MKKRMGYFKVVTAGVLAIGMFLTSIVIFPNRVEATETLDLSNTVIYDENYDIATYWNNNKEAPLKNGYVFGGWFKIVQDSEEEAEILTSIKDGTTKKRCLPLTEEEIDSDGNGKVDDGITAVAKFVPAQVLSVKAQNGVDPSTTAFTKLTEETATKIDEDNPIWVRVISSLDSANYKNWGFDIYLANKIKVEKTGGGDCITTKKYEGLLQGNASDSGVTEKDAGEIFGITSNYVFVWQLNKINHKNNVNKIIYVRPYWHTMDGTKVLGLAKYVHIEDQYMDYISVPVNILSTKDIAAGTISMKYNFEELEPISDDKDVYFEEGRIFAEMGVNHNSTAKTFSMIGNATEINKYNSSETIYANLRFKKPTIASNLNFNMSLGEFCNWSEEPVGNENVKVWDIAYEVEEPTN